MTSETDDFNRIRSDEWVKKMTKDESRIFLIVGMKQNRAFTFVCDESQTPEKIAQKLEDLAKAIRLKNSFSN